MTFLVYLKKEFSTCNESGNIYRPNEFSAPTDFSIATLTPLNFENLNTHLSFTVVKCNKIC